MVGHNDGCVQQQAFSVESQHAFLYDGSDVLSGQCAGTISSIQPFFQAITKAVHVFQELLITPGFGIVLEPDIFFFLPCFEFILWKRIRKAERDPIQYCVAGPMRQMPEGFLDWNTGRESG